ncbi:DUF2306 domain-containing protein [uncultured Chryseobacterium sp.]|uniref:DUF2306 domain-containing protein n=1 Tax=uncultured Chryseobacterium sp. TaxID=259322 RepID=UPI0025DB21C3|nr:DUF2306 domain-containing protein [uncultured Chryseobacterium sp.]
MRKLLFAIMCIFALLVGAYPLLYAFVESKYTFLSSKSPEILHSVIWKIAFFAHIIFGGLALFIGWRQFGPSFRSRYIALHRAIGKIYVIAVIISSVSAVYMGFYANGGLVSETGFILLAITWLMTTAIAVAKIRNGQVIQHQQLMTYSYACAFAAVTLRIWYPLLIQMTGDPVNSYSIVAWLCWIPNILTAYFLNMRLKT